MSVGNETPRKISKRDFLKVFLRSFFVQSLWNFRSLISVGFGISLFPILKKLYKTPEEQRAFLLRHFRFFNAHPYLVSYALGVAIRLEEEIAEGHPDVERKLERVKELLISILGSVGDQLFWFTIRPFSLLIGIVGVYVFPTIEGKIGALGIAFLIYNIPHFYWRYKGIVEGYQFGVEVYKCFQEGRFQRIQNFYATMGLLLFVGFFAILSMHYWQLGGVNAVVFWGSVVYSAGFYYLTRNVYFTILFTILFFIVVGIIFL